MTDYEKINALFKNLQGIILEEEKDFPRGIGNPFGVTLVMSLIEKKLKWREYSFGTDGCERIPFIEFPRKWRVQVVPPMTGAMVRFRVWIPGMPKDESISIYLDVNNSLGIYSLEGDVPYWEVYPVDGNTFRCAMADTQALLAAIKRGAKTNWIEFNAERENLSSDLADLGEMAKKRAEKTLKLVPGPPPDGDAA